LSGSSAQDSEQSRRSWPRGGHLGYSDANGPPQGLGRHTGPVPPRYGEYIGGPGGGAKCGNGDGDGLCRTAAR